MTDPSAASDETALGWFDRMLFILLALCFFTLPLNVIRIGSVPAGDLLVLVVLLLFPVTLLRSGMSFRAVPKWSVLAALGLVAGGVMSVIFPATLDPETFRDLTTLGKPYGSAIAVEVRLLLALLAMPVAVSVIVRSWRQVGQLAAFWVAGVALSCLVALTDAVFGSGIQLWLAPDPDTARGLMGIVETGSAIRQVGLTDHPNALGLTAAMALPVAIAGLRTPRSFRLFGPLTALLIAGVALSGSRTAAVGGIVAVIGGVLVLRETGGGGPRRWWDGFFRRGHRLRTIAPVGLIVVVLVGLAVSMLPKSTPLEPGVPAGAPVVNTPVTRVIEPFGVETETSNTARVTLLRAGANAVRQAPVGGLGFGWIEIPHNLVLALLMSGGVLALAGFGIAMFGYIREGLDVRRRVGPERALPISAALVSVAVFLAAAMLNNYSLNRYLYIPMSLLLAGRYLTLRDSFGASPAPEPAGASPARDRQTVG